MAKRVPYLTIPQIITMTNVSKSVVYTAIKNKELIPINQPRDGAKKFFKKFEPAQVNEWISMRFGKPKAKDLPLFKNVPGVQVNAAGKLTTIDEKLDLILQGINDLKQIWS